MATAKYHASFKCQYLSKNSDTELQIITDIRSNYLETRSFKTAIYGTFVRRMRKDVRYCFDKNDDEHLQSKLE